MDLFTLTALCILHLIGQLSGFRTGSCDHDRLEQTNQGLELCIKSNLDETDLCSSFSVVDLCFPQEFGNCFNMTEVKKMAMWQKSHMRKALEGIFEEQQMTFGGFDSGSLFDSCSKMPTHQDAENSNNKLVVWLDQVMTDGTCSQTEKDSANLHSARCMDDQRKKIEKRLQSVFGVKKTNLQDRVCRVLEETVGVCLQQPLPSCFSDRETDFLRSSMSEEFKEVFIAMEELLGPSYQLSTAECQVWENRSLLGGQVVVQDNQVEEKESGIGSGSAGLVGGYLLSFCLITIVVFLNL